MNNNTMPERLYLEEGDYRNVYEDSTVPWTGGTEYIRADVAQSQLDAARADAIDERNRQAAYIAHLQQRIAERDARINELVALVEADAASTETYKRLIRELQKSDDEKHKQLAAANARIAELEAAQQWVSVDERLPDDEDNGVIAWTNNASEYSSYNFDLAFYHKNFGWLMATEWEHGDPTVTHWMPLPPPP